MRYFIELRYDGGAYCGWQRQPIQPSVQQTIEDGLSRILREKTDIVGAGRTDTGVNASYYVAHFDFGAPVDLPLLKYKMNMLLPDDISIDAIMPVADDAHARYDATEREYTYRIALEKDPFLRDRAWIFHLPLDMGRMNEAASILLEEEDFTSFAKLNSNNHTNICHVIHAEWEWEVAGTVMIFRIRANRFLRNMVRSIVGTLVDVGRGRYTVEQFREIVMSRDLARSSAGAPSQGLFLSDVVYPHDIFVRTR